MIEIELPKDITKYEAKLAGTVTPRQALCITLAAVFGFIARMVCNSLELYSITTPAMMLVGAIPLAFVAYKPFNMNLEDFLRQAFINNILAPSKRKYILENTFAEQYKVLQDEEKKVIGAYNKVYNIKVPQRRINDPKDRPRQKINKRNPELTGYL